MGNFMLLCSVLVVGKINFIVLILDQIFVFKKEDAQIMLPLKSSLKSTYNPIPYFF